MMKNAHPFPLGLTLTILIVLASNALATTYLNLVPTAEKWFISQGTNKYVTLRMHTKVANYPGGLYVMRRDILHNDIITSTEDLLFSHNGEGDVFFYGDLQKTVFEEPVLWVDAPLAVGKSWTASRPAVNGDDDPNDQIHYVFAVLDDSPVRCPLGEFPCFRVFMSAVYPDGRIENSSFWYNQTCGMVLCTLENARIFGLVKAFVGDNPDGDDYLPLHPVDSAELSGVTGFPNPANPSTTISFDLAAPTRVDVAIYDIAGRLIKSLSNDQPFPAGPVSLLWQGNDQTGRAVASGTYLYRIQAGQLVQTDRITLVR
jgi:hypothetical protein